MKQHAREEGCEVPLLRSFFAPSEVQPVVDEMLASLPGPAMGSFIYYAGEEFFNFMSQEGISGFSCPRCKLIRCMCMHLHASDSIS